MDRGKMNLFTTPFWVQVRRLLPRKYTVASVADRRAARTAAARGRRRREGVVVGDGGAPPRGRAAEPGGGRRPRERQRRDEPRAPREPRGVVV